MTTYTVNLKTLTFTVDPKNSLFIVNPKIAVSATQSIRNLIPLGLSGDVTSPKFSVFVVNPQ